MTGVIKIPMFILIVSIFARVVSVSCLVDFKYGKLQAIELESTGKFCDNECFVFYALDPIIFSRAELNAIQSISPSEWLNFVQYGIESDNKEEG